MKYNKKNMIFCNYKIKPKFVFDELEEHQRQFFLLIHENSLHNFISDVLACTYQPHFSAQEAGFEP